MTQATHERPSATETLVAGSDGWFGVVMGGRILDHCLINGWYGGWVWPWTAGVAALFLLAALLRPVPLSHETRLPTALMKQSSPAKQDYSSAFELD